MKESKLYYAVISGGFGKCGMCQKKMYMLGVRETKELRKKKLVFCSLLFSAIFVSN